MRTTPITYPALAGLLATLALAPGAARAGQPLAANGLPLDPAARTGGTLAEGGSQTWRLYLQQGKDYAVWGENDGQQIVTVRAAGGATLARFPLADGDDQPEGQGFRATYTGLVFVTVTGAGDYSLSADRDCAGDLSTRCGIAVGDTLDGLQMRFAQDSDWFRTRLRGGTTYRIDIADPDPRDCFNSARVAVRDARGRRLAWAEWACAPSPALIFQAPAAGTYYVVVEDDGSTPIAGYSLGLSVSR